MAFRTIALALALGCGLTAAADAKPKHITRPRAVQPRVKPRKSKNNAYRARKIRPRRPPKHNA